MPGGACATVSLASSDRCTSSTALPLPQAAGVLLTTDCAKKEYQNVCSKFTAVSVTPIGCESFRYMRIDKSLCQHPPIFPGRLQPSIFGTLQLNFRVRNGNGCTLHVNHTDFFIQYLPQRPSRLCSPASSLLVHLRGLEPRTH